MDYRALGRSGLAVSAIGLGGVTFRREIDEVTSFAVLDRALERGLRDQIVLATKVAPPLTPERIAASAEESLRRKGWGWPGS